MPDDVDEDLIEATIRRVAEARAAREGEAESETAPGAPEQDPEAVADAAELSADEEPLEPATGAVVEPRGDHLDSPALPNQRAHAIDEDAIAATIARVQAQKAAADAAPDAGLREPPDEDAIAATIRRVQAQKAAQELRYDDDDDAVAAPAHAATGERGDEIAIQIGVNEQIDDVDTFEPVSEVSANDDAIARLERALREAHHAITMLTARVDALERAAVDAPRRAQITALTGTDGETRPASQHPVTRPTIVRDELPPQRAALAEQLPTPDAIDTRPLPQPLPPIHVESRRGLDLLPRTYRITVEDKRRGVDLVPLHRALLSMDGVRDMSLLSYNNGVAIVSLETTGDLDGDELGDFVSRAMSRGAKVEQHNEHTFVVKLAEA